jgi:2-keto-4-pentenoate hydratase/2-oxohepta-3-ene-1,7-dioic acid hydratase in catechol pathway
MNPTMRLATLHTAKGPRAVLAREEDYVDLHDADPNLPPRVKSILADYERYRPAIAAVSNAPASGSLRSAVFLPPIPDPGKILCIGLNYRDHALEGGKAIPTEPVLFGKFANALIAHEQAIRLPRVSQKVDYEAELVVVIGRRGRYISEARAMEYVGGYTIGHDVSARDWQFRGEEKQWMIGKTFDTFAPTGPYLVTADELTDPHHLQVQLRLNGQTMQNSNTREFIFTVPQLLAYVSQVLTLEPGDLIFTGTPPGVGAARKPPVFLKPGDVTEVEIEHLGVLRNTVEAESI